ncbi:MAG: hypothetical protein WBB85_00325 [Albidovulum sp.]|uniref:hypothetical protein n=1 Tax=Albidovulum sp. TaxID=1872424 RepID=UPI003C9769BA
MRLLPLIFALSLATPAAAFTAQNGLIVEPQGADGFSVPWRGKSGPAAFWCAAGDYAIRVLHLAPTDVIYRASEPPRRAGEPMDFTLNPEASASTTGLFSLFQRGGGLSVGHAQSLCEFRQKRR